MAKKVQILFKIKILWPYGLQYISRPDLLEHFFIFFIKHKWKTYSFDLGKLVILTHLHSSFVMGFIKSFMLSLMKINMSKKNHLKKISLLPEYD